ncbi:UNKNOWN [Stylonychia lemnae]|uniref:Uncharacterized protein n=1 Tax=Stylonychia lemnae TaxID=5949 RepID=A0A078B0I1_STYLE|nr:UNKNOWN [Stylonychia lemnae]|eukprot:CDW88165.1 UNKNOWN [Stylonychia lemnae]
MENSMFKLGKVLNKYIFIDILGSNGINETKRLLWRTNKQARMFLIKMLKQINNNIGKRYVKGIIKQRLAERTDSTVSQQEFRSYIYKKMLSQAYIFSKIQLTQEAQLSKRIDPAFKIRIILIKRCKCLEA